jgi:hypothetical protein
MTFTGNVQRKAIKGPAKASVKLPKLQGITA